MIPALCGLLPEGNRRGSCDATSEGIRGAPRRRATVARGEAATVHRARGGWLRSAPVRLATSAMERKRRDRCTVEQTSARRGGRRAGSHHACLASALDFRSGACPTCTCGLFRARLRARASASEPDPSWDPDAYASTRTSGEALAGVSVSEVASSLRAPVELGPRACRCSAAPSR